jgi:hypothetical protein
VAHRVAHLGALGGQFAAPRHRRKSSRLPLSQPFKGAAGLKSQVLSGTADV